MAAEPMGLEAPQARYHFKKRALLALLPAIVIISVFMLYSAWELADPNWYPTGRRKRVVGELLYAIPWWLRGMLFAAFGGTGILVSVAYIFHSFDGKPDFAIGPEGISRNHLFRRLRLSWADVRSVKLENDKILISGSVAHASSRRALIIDYNPLVFGGTSGEVLTLIRHYRPDLVTDEMIQSATEDWRPIRQILRASDG